MGLSTNLPSSVLSAFEEGYEALRVGGTTLPKRFVEDGVEWYCVVSGGCLFFRKADLAKWPSHDKSPDKKREEAGNV
jgi:hypothetical protein